MKQILIITLFILVFASCSHKRFGYLNKVKVDKNLQMNSSLQRHSEIHFAHLNPKIKKSISANISPKQISDLKPRERQNKPVVKAKGEKRKLLGDNKSYQSSSKDKINPDPFLPEYKRLSILSVVAFFLAMTGIVMFSLIFVGLDAGVLLIFLALLSLLALILGIIADLRFNEKKQWGNGFAQAGYITGALLLITSFLLTILIFMGLNN